jgi:hypothetical protein
MQMSEGRCPGRQVWRKRTVTNSVANRMDGREWSEGEAFALGPGGSSGTAE